MIILTLKYINSFLQWILNVLIDILNQSRGILLLRIKNLFASAFSPTFFLFALEEQNFVCREVKIWLKFSATHSVWKIG